MNIFGVIVLAILAAFLLSIIVVLALLVVFAFREASDDDGYGGEASPGFC